MAADGQKTPEKILAVLAGWEGVKAVAAGVAARDRTKKPVVLLASEPVAKAVRKLKNMRTDSSDSEGERSGGQRRRLAQAAALPPVMPQLVPQMVPQMMPPMMPQMMPQMMVHQPAPQLYGGSGGAALMGRRPPAGNAIGVANPATA